MPVVLRIWTRVAHSTYARIPLTARAHSCGISCLTRLAGEECGAARALQEQLRSWQSERNEKKKIDYTLTLHLFLLKWT